MTTTNRTSHPIALRDATVTDPFWASRQELVRTQVIPYQWNALNDNVPGAAPSYCMHNFKAAAAQNAEHHKEGKAFVPPKYTFRGFEALPDDPAHPDSDKFYGFVFQDTDFSKWIEAVGYSLTHHPDADLEATADTAIDIVCAAQLDNGYLDTYYILNGMDRHFTNLKDHHELYCFGHLTEGAIAYYQATGKRKLLDAACRFADYIDSRFGTADGKLHGYPGHEIAEMALVKLAETTGEQRYADLAEYFVRQRGRQPLYFELEDRRRAREDGRNYAPREQNYAYYQADKPITEQTEALGHAVRAAYFYAGAADVARLTGDSTCWHPANDYGATSSTESSTSPAVSAPHTWGRPSPSTMICRTTPPIRKAAPPSRSRSSPAACWKSSRNPNMRTSWNRRCTTPRSPAWHSMAKASST